MIFNNPERVASLTPLYPFDRLADGRPAVPDEILERMRKVTNDEAWLPETFGAGPKICFVLKSRRSMRASRPFISLMKSQRPSYSPFVSESAG